MSAGHSIRSLSAASGNSDRDLLEMLFRGSGVEINGPHAHDIQVHDPSFIRRVLAHGTLGAGESYMDGQWDSARLDEMMFRLVRTGVEARIPLWRRFWAGLTARLIDLQRGARAFAVARRHYDIGDDLFESMLDPRMMYSCAYWRSATSLAQAQEHKLDLVCRKLGFAPGMSVLDIGCGWGGAAQFAAERYGVTVTGVTVSRNQAAAASARCKDLPVTILLQDYRSLRGRFDRIYSLGMFEHVGPRHYREFFSVVRRLLPPDGMFLLHTIGSNVSRQVNDAFTEAYIFPNSLLPSMQQIAAAVEESFVVEDWHAFGVDYDRTLMEWYRRFEDGWSVLAGRYGERFRRMWTFWLLSSAACFRARASQLWQIVLSPQGIVGGCPEVR